MDALHHMHSVIEDAEDRELATKRHERVFSGCCGDYAQSDQACRHPYHCFQPVQPKRSLWQRVKAWFVGDESWE
jgi:hypothetical protein